MKSCVAPESKRDNWVTIEGKCIDKDMSIVRNILHGGVIHSVGLGSNNSRRMVGVSLWMRHNNLPQCHTFLDKMTSITTVLVGAGNCAHIL
jgi:hypothetical protein